MISEEDLKKYHLIEIDGERVLGRAEDIAKYLRWCLIETLNQFIADGLDWKDEAEPVIGELYDYMITAQSQHGALYTLSENPMCPSNVYMKKFEEKE